MRSGPIRLTFTGRDAIGATRRYSSSGTLRSSLSRATAGRRWTTGVPGPARSGISQRLSGVAPAERCSCVLTFSAAPANPETESPKLSWKFSRLISPSVTTSSPTDSCRRTWFFTHSFSTRANSRASISPDSNRSRASFQGAGRSRLPTTSVRIRLRALKQRSPHQERLVPPRVGGGFAQLGEALRALRRLALLQALLVGDGLLLDILDVQRSSFGFIFIEQAP